MALRNSQYDTILRTYYSRQLEHKHEKDKRVNEVYEHVPAIAEIDKSIASMSVSQAKKLLSGDTDALATLKSDIACMALLGFLLRQPQGHELDDLIPGNFADGCLMDQGGVDGGKADNRVLHSRKQLHSNRNSGSEGERK